MSSTAWANDAIIQPLIAAAAADPDVEGLLLGGSRGAGMADHESDYDLEWVLTDAAYDQRVARGEQLHVSQDPAAPLLDISYTCFRTLAQIDTLADQGWPPGYLHTTLLRLVQTGDPALQQDLELKVEALLRARGYEFSLWEGEIDRVKAFVFNKE